jgi:hypothetical protein
LAVLAIVVSVAALVVAALAYAKEPDALPPPTKNVPGLYTKALVDEAIQYYSREGRAAAVEYYSDPANVDGEWYVFIINEEGRTIAHHNPIFLDRDPEERVDSTGYYYGEPLLATTEDGRWVDYTLLNPESGDEAKKHTWAKLHDGLIFGSGWYER